jgi:hypothetical protein
MPCVSASVFSAVGEKYKGDKEHLRKGEINNPEGILKSYDAETFISSPIPPEYTG